MNLAEKLTQVKQSEIFKLVFGGEVAGISKQFKINGEDFEYSDIQVGALLGYRVKFFNIETEKFEYYDFEIEAVTSPGVAQFIRSIPDMRSIQLCRTGNGRLVSDEELAGLEVLEASDIVKILTPFPRIYDSKEVPLNV